MDRLEEDTYLVVVIALAFLMVAFLMVASQVTFVTRLADHKVPFQHRVIVDYTC